jgi:hypothetical protein
MSKIALTPSATGTGVFTISSPATNTDRTLTLPDEAGSIVVNTATGIDVTGTVVADGLSVNSTALVTGVLTTTAATVFNGGFASNAASTITTDDNTAQLTLISTDADANQGPVLVLDRQSASPADGDLIGRIFFNGKNDAAEAHGYAKIEARIVDASNATEDGRLELMTSVATTEGVSRILMDATETVINNDSKDLDFRVESEGNANMLFVDGGENAVGIGTIPPAWRAGLADVGFNVGVNAALYDQTGGGVFLVNNWYRADGNTLTYRNTNEAQYMQMEGGEFSFANAASGSAGATITFTERMKIDASGGLILAGSTAQKATGTTWSNPSDQRLKTDIRDYTKGSAELMQVRVREWLYNGKGGTVDGMAGLGVIADEVMTVLPDTVETYEAFLEKTDELPTAIKKFDATEITWLLVTSLQEALTEISALKVRVAALEAV